MEIDKLPPEVAEAIAALDAMTYARLAEENARLLSIQIGMHRDVCANALRAEEAEARVQELEREKIALVAERDHAKLLQRKAESERDALKARIAAAIETVKHEGVWSDGPSEPFARIMEMLEDSE